MPEHGDKKNGCEWVCGGKEVVGQPLKEMRHKRITPHGSSPAKGYSFPGRSQQQGGPSVTQRGRAQLRTASQIRESKRGGGR